ncbi:hypothetical protein IAQ61_004020 [Plenodomus lingam]|uniref:uncharacterized protein n=1 Tax=Leptosphaeria maculans TaxID=5022 RepID=UPI00331C0EC0|nr:hypothetical protein IAQ61_004020 [Plenodomus lingam]
MQISFLTLVPFLASGLANVALAEICCAYGATSPVGDVSRSVGFKQSLARGPLETGTIEFPTAPYSCKITVDRGANLPCKQWRYVKIAQASRIPGKPIF